MTLSPILMALLILSCFACVAALLMRAGSTVLRKLSGWSEVVARFPMTDAADPGETYKRQIGSVQNVSCRFSTRVGRAGVCLYPSFARRDPCRVPWTGFRRVSVNDFGIHLVVEHEGTFDFRLPLAALPVVKASVAPDLLQQSPPPSFSRAIPALKEQLK